MTGSVTALFYAMAAFVGSHVFFAWAPVRGPLTQRLGEGLFRGLYSLKSAALMVWIVMAYRSAYDVTVGEPLWELAGANHLTMLLMLVAFPLAACGLMSRNPTAAGQAHRLEAEDGGIRGIVTITRHPFLSAVALWSIGHLVANGDPRSLVFFGGWLSLAVIGMIHIDAKLAARRPEAAARFFAGTSRIPLWAAISGRGRVDWSGIGVLNVAIGLVFYGILLLIHGRLFGVSPLPGL